MRKVNSRCTFIASHGFTLWPPEPVHVLTLNDEERLVTYAQEIIPQLRGEHRRRGECDWITRSDAPRSVAHCCKPTLKNAGGPVVLG